MCGECGDVNRILREKTESMPSARAFLIFVNRSCRAIQEADSTYVDTRSWK